ncbi:hypothetical protein BJY01DRAFT_242837 [Aspergillus pseudoustus]|uniref:Ubiquitin 3 binding protein But2 C-terminal domain-containing protein n=1 Tax=Aspergillus pseudoustus TaxID=1810923 RepID=A0ABR4KXG0_9EURO
MKAFLCVTFLNSLFALGVNALALPQFGSAETSLDSLPTPTSGIPSPSISGVAATDVPSLTESDLASLPLIPVAGDDSSAIVQASNTSLIETHPEIDAEPEIELPYIPSNLTRRDQCVGGPFASPLTPWTNVKLLTDRVCDFWFPNNNVFHVPAPLPAPGYVLVQIPFGPSLPTLNVRYQTRNPLPVTDLFTPLTSTICKRRFDSILAFATAPGNFQCPSPPNVHAGNDCDVNTRAACFSFYLN